MPAFTRTISAAIHMSRSSSSSRASSPSPEDEDAITTCPTQPEPAPVLQHHLRQQQRGAHQHDEARRRSSSWRHRDSVDGQEDEVDTQLLWKRMLLVQRAFGCYNSARMSAALEMDSDELASQYVPSRTCLDLLNDSITSLPEEARREVDEFLEHGRPHRRSGLRQFLMHGAGAYNHNHQ